MNRPAAAAEAARKVGFPVAVKVAEPNVVHRTERGLVRTGLTTIASVQEAVADFRGSYGGDCDVLVQPMHEGVELALGVVNDESLGPLIMVAAGGVATDVWDDRAFLLPPFGPEEALRAVKGLRIWPLLAGFRGSAPAATRDLANVLSALGQLAADVPEVEELDLNPVLVGAAAVHLVDWKLRLAERPARRAELPGAPRQLRPT